LIGFDLSFPFLDFRRSSSFHLLVTPERLERSHAPAQIGRVSQVLLETPPAGEEVAMKRSISTVMVLFAFVVIAASLLAHAQTNYQYIRANVPFEFVVNGQVLPAGSYDFCWNRNFVAAVRLATPGNANSQPIRYTQINAVEPTLKDKIPAVIFHQVSNRYFLAEIHQPDAGLVMLTTTKEEKRMQQLAGVKTVKIEAEGGK